MLQYATMIGLSEERLKHLKEIGFKRYIHFLIVILAYHVIENFHTPSMELRLQKGSIKATRQKVYDMLEKAAILGLNILPRSSSYPSQTGTQKLEHNDDEEKDNIRNSKKMLGKAGTSWSFTNISEERLELVETLRDGMNKFNRDQTMFDFCKEYKKVFKNVEFHLDDSFIDEDSDSDGDFDNDSNNNHEDRTPMTDENTTGNEHNENDNEK
ncbi:hypothetical protein Tco_1348693 [Tanacetum coccineum]